MVVFLLADLINDGTLEMHDSVERQGLVDVLRRTDLSITLSVGWIATALPRNITIRPNHPGNYDMRLVPNRFQTKEEEYDENAKKDFAERYGFNVGELIPVKEVYTDFTGKELKLRAGYMILLNEEGRINPFLGINSFYEPT